MATTPKDSGIGNNRTPFSTADGNVPGATSISKPADLLAKPSGSGDSTPPRDPMQSVPQKPADEEEVERYIGPADRSVRQQPGSAAQRVNPTSIPQGGPGIRDTPSVPRAGTGSVGAGRLPFKVK